MRRWTFLKNENNCVVGHLRFFLYSTIFFLRRCIGDTIFFLKSHNNNLRFFFRQSTMDINMNAANAFHLFRVSIGNATTAAVVT